MNDKLIHDVVIKRIEEATACSDVALLKKHLSSSYDAEIHRAVYQALGCVGGRESIAALLEVASQEDSEEMKGVIFQALTDAMSARTGSPR